VPEPRVPDAIRRWFGDFDWPGRKPSVFDDPRFSAVVPDRNAAIAEIARLYPADVCRALVEQGHRWMIQGLFGGMFTWADELLLLGADLVLCAGWELRPRLVGRLRSPDGYRGARFEIGVQAGLQRLGYKPLLERDAAARQKQVDLLVRDGPLDVALELKTLSDPSFERNLEELTYQLASVICLGMGLDWRGDVDLRLSDHAKACLRKPHVAFFMQHWPEIESELRAAIPRIRHAVDIPLPTSGTLLVRAPVVVDGFLGSYAIDGVHHLDSIRLAQRVVHKVRESATQLAGARADLRVAVIFGSAKLLPAGLIADALTAALAAQPDSKIADAVDWIAIVNCEGGPPEQSWQKALATCRLPRTCTHIPPGVERALLAWGR
jgi:hypothetical protein